jgi:hypothetical protein
VPQAYTLILAIVVVGLFGYVRTRTALRGTRVRQARIYGLCAFYLAFASYLTFNSVASGVPLIYIVPYSITFIASEYFSNRYSDNALFFWKTVDGKVYSKGGVVVYLTYVATVGVRISISLFLLGSISTLFDYNPVAATQQQMDSNIVLGLIVSDFLIMVGAGLLFGLNRRMNLHYNSIREGREVVPVL